MGRLPAILAAFTLGACSPGAARQVSPAAPTIVSLNPCTDAILAEVADPRQLLALSHYSADPASSSMDVNVARRFPAVSGSVEEVLALRPDVVVAGNFLPPATVSAFGRLGIRLVQVPIAQSLDESRAQVAMLSRLAGNPERGAALNARMERALDAARPPGGQAPVTAVVWESGGIVPGRDTLISELLERTGFTNFSAERGLRQADVLPLETLLAHPPRVILAAGNSRWGEDRMLAHPVLGRLSGTRRERLDQSLLWCGGPTVIRAAARLAQVRRSL